MPRNNKLFIHKKAYFVTFSTEQGLPLVPNHLINTILEGIIAKASQLYRIKIAHFVFMNNHAHFIIVVESPADVYRFFQYVKRESAHMINRLLGRVKRTIWCDGYDSPILLDIDTALDKVVYLYTNPQKADLVNSIEEYPGLNSWDMYVNDRHSLKTKRIARKQIKPLSSTKLDQSFATLIAMRYLSESTEKVVLTLEPDALLECFDELENKEQIKQTIQRRVQTQEKILQLERLRKGKKVIGAKALSHQCLNKTYEPKRKGKKMICLGREKKNRAEYIKFFKNYMQSGKELLKQFSQGQRQLVPVPGIFLPGGILLANLLPQYVPI